LLPYTLRRLRAGDARQAENLYLVRYLANNQS
jgi:hypothetical protein